jgi:hypothetical protein
VAQDGRFPDGGAVGISYAWTADGGVHWHHQRVPGLTSGTGGGPTWTRVSDPVAAFDTTGRAYVSTILLNLDQCRSAVAVSRSADGGRTFEAPVVVHRSDSCAVLDDKAWLVADTSAGSPRRGRLYQFWTPVLTDVFGNPDGSPQAVSWSDDHGRTWTAPVAVTAPHANTENSQPMPLPDGTVVLSYLDFGSQPGREGGEAARGIPSRRARGPRLAEQPGLQVATRISHDGGRTWTPGGVITRDLGGGNLDGMPAGVRCCLPSAVSDPVTGRMYAAWSAAGGHRLLLSSSTDGSHWSPPRRINPASGDAFGVNVDVSAYRGTVGVSYGLTNADASRGRFARQYAVISPDSGAHWSAPAVVGPRSNYRFAAQARGIFPGDYIGTALNRDRLYAVWCVAGKPRKAGAAFRSIRSNTPPPSTPARACDALGRTRQYGLSSRPTSSPRGDPIWTTTCC